MNFMKGEIPLYTINVAKIKGKMAEKGYTNTRLSEVVGVSRNTLANYFSNPNNMPYEMVGKLASILCDSDEEAAGIFFAQKLA